MTHVNNENYFFGGLCVGATVSGDVHVSFGNKDIAFLHGHSLEDVLKFD